MSVRSANSVLDRRPGDHGKDAGSRPAATIVIEPPRGWGRTDWVALWHYRELLWVLTERDIRVRYKQTALGLAWAIIQPVVLMVVFSIFFGRLAKMPADGLPYPVFVYAALLPWTFTANTITTATNSLLASAGLVSKVYFPRLLIPLSSAGSGLVDFGVALVILLVMMLWYGVGWSAAMLLAPVLIAGMILIALGLGIFLAAVIVAYRDFRYVVPFMLQFWMFATPVVYPASLVPQQWRWLLFLNPMAGLIEGFRSAFLGRPFQATALAVALATAVAIFFAGIAYFENVERRFADII